MSYIFTKARLYCPEGSASPGQDSLLVEGDRIACVGTYRQCRQAAKTSTELIDLGGRALLPGLTDTHTHLTEFAKKRFELDLAGCTTTLEIRRRMDEFRARRVSLPAWILGGGWDRNRLDEPARITVELLDEFFPDIPVALFSKDYHSRWCNSVALRLAGIGPQTPDPPGGKIHRDSDGLPNGILSETASEQLDRHIVPPTPEQLRAALRQSLPELYALGLTTLHSMETESGADLLQDLAAERALRVCCHFPLDELDRAIAQNRISYSGNDWFKWGGVKIFADGSLGSQTAAIDAPYPGSIDNCGILRLSTPELLDIAERALSNRIGCTVHAIGNRAVNTVIKAFWQLRQQHPESTVLQRIEHLQSLRPGDLPALKESGAYCSVQPVHLANDVPMIETLWALLRDQAYNFATLRDAGVPMGFGSDAPIETINPFLGVFSAIARKLGLDPNQPSWRPEQRLSAEHALAAYTLGAAQGSQSEQQAGSLAVGKYADLAVLEDWTPLPDTYWLEARSLLTLLGGRIVHDLL